MIIFIDTFNNMIKTVRLESKKETPYYYEESYDFDLSIFENKLKAISLFSASEGGIELKKGRYHQLILSDDLLGLGQMALKNVGRQKYYDVFMTQVRLSFPKPDVDYFYRGYEYDRDDKNVYFNYEIAKRDYINRLLTVFRNGGISLADKNVFASIFCVRDKNTVPYPIPVLIIGKNNSELAIVKGDKVLSINVFGYGSDVLLDGNSYLNSAYNYDNERCLKLASLIKNHIASGEEINDANINNANAEEALNYIEPKEKRLLKEKEEQLHAYNIHNNFRKLYARILEITEYYAKAPWYFPLKDINVIASSEVMANLIDITKEDEAIRFVAFYQNVNDIIEKGIVDDKLYSQGIKKERRKIDWKAFLTMEIGGKKKKA